MIARIAVAALLAACSAGPAFAQDRPSIPQVQEQLQRLLPNQQRPDTERNNGREDDARQGETRDDRGSRRDREPRLQPRDEDRPAARDRNQDREDND